MTGRARAIIGARVDDNRAIGSLLVVISIRILGDDIPLSDSKCGSMI